ncbi:hypothetical protein ABIE69_001447 [Rhodobacteraceae bacterium MBR-64]|jgi:hypothetical protein
MTLFKRLSVIGASGAIALAVITAPAPARADDTGLIAALAGIAALAIIIDNNDGNHDRRGYHSSRRSYSYGHDRYDRGDRRGGRFDHGHRGDSRYNRHGGGRDGHDGGRWDGRHSR